MTLFSQFRRMMKWNSNCNSNCREGKKDRSRIAISRHHLGALIRLELSQWILVHTGSVALQHVGSSQIKPVSLALAGGFFTIEPPGKS